MNRKLCYSKPILQFSEENQRNWMDKLASSSSAAPSESVRLSIQNDLNNHHAATQQQQRPLVSEPLYENVALQQVPMTSYDLILLCIKETKLLLI